MAVDSEVKALARQIADLEEQVRALSTARQIARSTVPVHDGTGVVDMLVPDALGRGVTAATELPEVREKIDAAQAELEQLESKLGDAEGELSGLRERLSTAEGEIASIGEVAGSAAADADAALESSGAAQAAADAAQAEADAIAARGTDLITNGNALLGLRNFSQFQLVQGDQPVGTAGSFDAGTGQVARPLDELVPVDPSKPLLASMWVRQASPGVSSTCYFGMAPYDADGLGILPYHYMEQAGTRTTLAADLRPGDTTVVLASASGWNAGATTHMRSLIIWDYIDGKGKAWPPGTYSRHSYLNLWDAGAITGNTITLRAPWAGHAVPAGTAVGNSMSGGNYMYAPGIANAAVPHEWKQLTATAPYQGIHTTPGTAATTAWPVATTQARPIILANYSVSGGTSRQLFAGISLSETRAAQATANAKPGLFFSTNAPTTANTAPQGSIWFRTNASGQVIGQWQQTDPGIASTWTDRPVSSEVIANLDVGKLTAGTANLGTAVAQKIAAASGQFIELDVSQLRALEGVLDEAVIQKLWSDVVVQRMSIAEQFIGENAILNGAVTADKLYVDQAFIDKLFVNELLVEALSGRTITGATVRTAASGQRVELTSDNHVRLYAANGAIAGYMSGINNGASGALVSLSGDSAGQMGITVGAQSTGNTSVPTVYLTANAASFGDLLVGGRDVGAELQDTGWQPLTLASGWGAYAGETPHYRVKHGWVTFTGRTSGTAAAGATIGTLPPEARPGVAPFEPIYPGHSDNGTTILGVAKDGQVRIHSRAGQTRSGVSLASITFPAG